MVTPSPYYGGVGRWRKWWLRYVPLIVAVVIVAQLVFFRRLLDVGEGGARCSADLLERMDRVGYDRDFNKDPVFIDGDNRDWSSCSVGCKYGFTSDGKYDGTFSLHRDSETPSIRRSMESARYFCAHICNSSDDLTIKSLESAVHNKFKSLNHTPIWKNERPEMIRGGDALNTYRIHPVGMTQRQALYTFPI